ncbi:ferritin-like domain-containing protein [Ideonella livida]|uniref:Iminophenyl-pyruvate dimer synthase domain-containing protein n=1 Tax=Ideonella livida TaxID=2707176 RepID=A0A7C9PIG9_9BURK|nr:ferritin-like domain-containing protein [Ideonella livida]NDY92837.1 hypothetical protein [Ideonella livida]
MPSSLRSARPFGALFQHLRSDAPTLTDLQHAAQLALQVEFTTIPVYLSGMYSITDKGSTAYQALRAVVMEEMFHVNQAANLVIALGALPRFTGDAAPHYPGYLPHANEATTPLLGLYRASPDVFSNVYAAIETPAPAGAPAQADRYDTIAQLYEALVQGLMRYPGDPFATPAAEGRQRTDIYLGKFGGTVLQVSDMDSALRGIQQIVEQGEGRVPAGAPLVPQEPFGTYNQYGIRTDGTYGPILGTPLELSHFSRFRQVSLSSDPFPPTLPISSNPADEAFGNPLAQALSRSFNNAYSVMLHAFEQSFTAGMGDPYFGVVLNLMHQVLPQLALALMSTPAQQGGDASVGPNAAPTWRYLPQARMPGLRHAFQHLHQVVAGGAPAAVRQAVDQAQDGLDKLPQGLPALHTL